MQKFKQLSKDQLIKILSGLYKSSEDVRIFINTHIGALKEPLNIYLKKLKQALNSDEFDIDVAEKIISDYKLATEDDVGTAELLVARMELGNQYTLDYGDIDSDYYTTMEQCFNEAADHLIIMRKNNKKIDHYVDRLKAVVDSTDGIGWGYHDALCEMYSEIFGNT